MKITDFTILLTWFLLGGVFFPTAYADNMHFQETAVTIEDEIAGILISPDTSAQVPAVLMLHGFASQKDEVGDMYKRLAATLAERGIASLRIDFRGWGDSAGKMEESTIQGQIDDAAAAYAYLQELPTVDPARIGVLGFSLGGGIAIVSAAQHPNWYASMVTWSSVGNFKQDFLESLGQDNFDRAAKEGVVTIDLGWREITLGKGFFESLELYDPQQEITKYTGAFLAIAGSEDFSAAYTEGYVEHAAGSLTDTYILEGADHIFGVLGEDQSMAEDVIETTAQWFNDTL